MLRDSPLIGDMKQALALLLSLCGEVYQRTRGSSRDTVTCRDEAINRSIDIKRMILNASFCFTKQDGSARDINEFRCTKWILSYFELNNEFQDYNRYIFSRRNGSVLVECNEIVEVHFSQSRYVKTYHLTANYGSRQEERN